MSRTKGLGPHGGCRVPHPIDTGHGVTNKTLHEAIERALQEKFPPQLTQDFEFLPGTLKVQATDKGVRFSFSANELRHTFMGTAELAGTQGFSGFYSFADRQVTLLEKA